MADFPVDLESSEELQNWLTARFGLTVANRFTGWVGYGALAATETDIKSRLHDILDMGNKVWEELDLRGELCYE